jgi:hypothetical protein
MEIKIITQTDGQFIDAVSNDCNLVEWAETWIKDKEAYFDIEFYNYGRIHINIEDWGTYIIFNGDNGRLELEVITKII